MLMWVVLSSNFNTLLKATQVISPFSCAILGFTGNPGGGATRGGSFKDLFYSIPAAIVGVIHISVMLKGQPP